MLKKEAQELDEWYTAGEAAKRLSTLSGRRVAPSYINKLAQLGKIRSTRLHGRFVLYSRYDVDLYRVESRGAKSGEASKKRQEQSERKRQT